MTLSRRAPLARYAPMPPGDPAKALSRSRQPASGDASSAPLRARGRAPRTTGRGGIGQPKAVPSGEFSDKTKLLVRRRAGRGDEYDARAECCGAELGRDAGEFQHRAARGAGGCRDEIINGPANCLLMCPEHHRQAEDRDEDLGIGGAGFWLKHGTTPEFDPRNVPVRLHGRRYLYLAADGRGPDGTGYLYQRPQAVAA